MTREQERRQAKDLVDDFNRLDEKVQDKLLNGVKCLAFLYDLANTKNGDAAEHCNVPAQATAV